MTDTPHFDVDFVDRSALRRAAGPRSRTIRRTDWQERHARTGAGWFLGRFFFLLGEGLERLTPCLEAWSFLLPPAEERRILGYNAYGTLLVMDDEEQDGLVATVRMVDPLNVIVWSDPECVYTTLLNHWLADRALPNFFDTSVYLEWLEGAGRFLATTRSSASTRRYRSAAR